MKIEDEKNRATLEIHQVQKPWNKASAIFFKIMKEHAKLDLDEFAVRWVTLELRVDVNCAQTELMVSMVPVGFIHSWWQLGEQCGYFENDRAQC